MRSEVANLMPAVPFLGVLLDAVDSFLAESMGYFLPTITLMHWPRNVYSYENQAASQDTTCDGVVCIIFYVA